ncbi:MAG: phosphatidate cytidylyltransferase [Rhodospirillaceae bacterium]|nr:MAG: phosphatidate cytidylyltransferase [Rhodospirillaceae bacterium]
MLRTRVISAVILAPLFLGLIYLGFPYFHLLLAVIAAIMAWEFSTMDGREGRKRRVFTVLAAAAAVGATALLGFVAGLTIILATTIAKVVSDQAAGRSGFYLVQAAIPYVALPAITLLFVYASGGADSIYWILAVVWGTDIGAYAFGRLIGGPKLAPAISPKKTWAGAAGGLICGTGAAAGVMAALNMPLTLPMFGVAVLASLAAETGDLLESALKRWYDVKDSGTLIPGHGGLMDRFDGLWAAAPVAALFCVIFDGGVHRW